MLKILLVLLPLAASAACSYRDLSTCKKCGVGAIGMQFDSPGTPCNCNDNAGMYGKMCPKTGAPALPTCCSVDGKAATVQQCKCGTTSCYDGQKCTAATNKCEYPVCATTDGSAASTSENACKCGTASCYTGQKCTASSNTCAYPVCAKIDGSAASTSETECQCGTTSCSKGQKCTASSNTCADPPPPTCSSGASTVSQCKCGTASCYSGQTCTASTNTCKSPTVTACKEDVVVTAACLCTPGAASSEAKIGQTCPSTGINKGDPQWPACSGSDVFKTLNQNCKCADKNICSYGQKCTQTGDFKGFCECVLSDDVMCMEKVPPTEKCPKTCDGHTTMGATAYAIDKCIPNGRGGHTRFTAANNKIKYGTYSDSACKTMVGKMIELPAGCQDSMNTFWSLSPKNAAGGSTALQVAMPVALVAGLLGFILL